MHHEVLIVDDHPLYRAALKGAVATACADVEFFEADSVDGLFGALERHPHADLLLLDLNLPGARGFNALAYLRGVFPQLPVIVVSATDDARTVRRALAALAERGLVRAERGSGPPCSRLENRCSTRSPIADRRSRRSDQ